MSSSLYVAGLDGSEMDLTGVQIRMSSKHAQSNLLMTQSFNIMEGKHDESSGHVKITAFTAS